MAQPVNRPFFSVVIANYNHGRFLGDAIRSVFDQSCQDLELIIVDGGSTDNSVEVIKTFEDRIAWWCSEKDRGQSHAFNKGFAKAKGHFLTWLNADDLLLPGTLEKAKAKLLRHPECRWMTANFFRFLADGTIIECKWGPHLLPRLLQQLNAPVVVFGPTSFFARSLFEEIGGMDESLHYVMDTDLWLRFKAKAVWQVRLNHYAWAFRMHAESKTAEFGEHRHEAGKWERMGEEKKRIALKSNYAPSRLLHYLGLGWRILDGSLFIYLWNQTFRRGRKLKEIVR